METTNFDKFESFAYRKKALMAFYLKIFAVLYVLIILYALYEGIKTANYQVLLVVLWLIPILSLPVLGLIYLIFLDTVKYYLSSFSADEEKITLHYYEKDLLHTVSYAWKDLDFCFGATRYADYLVIWNNSDEVLKLTKNVADHKTKFDDLYATFSQHIPQELINTYRSFLGAVSVGTKLYSTKFWRFY